jgi:phage head maturation protease
MKKNIKLTDKLIEQYGLDLDINEVPEENRTVKRLSVENQLDLEEEGFVRGVISDVSIDSDGDVILPQAFDFKRFEKNPVVLFNHSLNSPVGFVEGITVDYESVTAKVRFGKTPEALKIYQLAKDRVLRTFSVGFITLDEVRKGQTGWQEEFNLLKNTYPDRFNDKSELSVDRIIKKALLIELSIVTIPSNMNAVIEEVKAIREGKEEKAVEVVEDIKEGLEEAIESAPKVEEVIEPVEEVVEVKEVETVEEVDEVVPETKKLVIKKVGKVSQTIKLVSTVQKEKQKELNELFLRNWGV